MLSEILKFSNSDVFSVTLEGEPEKTRHWFRATDLCAVLFDQKNAFRYVNQHCKDWQYREFQVGKGRPALYVCESGVYRLILRSKASIAIEFQDWLTEDILPKLRAEGGYIMPYATQRQLEALQSEISTLEAQNGVLKEQHVYKQLAASFVTNCLAYKKGGYEISGHWRQLLWAFWEPFIARFPEHSCMPRPTDQEVALMMQEVFRSLAIPKEKRVHFDSEGGMGDLRNCRLTFDPFKLPHNFKDCLKFGEFGGSFIATVAHQIGE